MEENTQAISTQIDQIQNDKTNIEEVSLDTLVLIVNANRLKQLNEKSEIEFKELKDLQAKVAKLHEIMKKINAATDEKGELDTTNNEEIKKLLEEAKELGVDVKEGKFKYKKEERDRLMENLRMTVEDHQVVCEMKMQTVNRLINERYESYQVAKSILKPLHESKMKMVQGITR